MKAPALLLCLCASVASAGAAPFDAAAANNAFGLDLYRQLAARQPDANLAFSPFSISEALALVTAGAAGSTRTQLDAALHLPADESAVRAGLAALCDTLDAAARKTAESLPARKRWDQSADVIEWHLANRLFAQTGYAFRESFLSLARTGYAAGLKPLDFQTHPDEARVTINKWVEDQTRKKIHDLIPRNGIDAATRLVLVNAIYLKAPWATRFEPRLTTSRPFLVRGTDARAVPTMTGEFDLPYLRRPGLTTVALPYLGGDLQFLIFLPDTGVSLKAVANQLTPRFLAQCGRLAADQPTAHIRLSLPKFKVAGPTFPLKSELRPLGVAAAFNDPVGSADFDPIAPRRPGDYLFIGEVFHQTYLAVDESGTEAAAATAVMALAGSAPPPPPREVRIDRPFLFALQHVPSGACLFLGQIVDPRE